MDFNFTEEQEMIASSARAIAKDFPPEYWREKDLKEEFGEEFYKESNKWGWIHRHNNPREVWGGRGGV